MSLHISIDRDRLAEVCRRHHIRSLAAFGSVLRDDFRPDSDIDVLVEFEPGQTPGFLRLYEIERALSALLGGRRIDFATPDTLNRLIRAEVLSEAETLYAER